MQSKWPMVKLGEVLEQVSRPEMVSPEKEYRILGAKWYAKGLYIKSIKSGNEIKAKKLYLVKKGDFVYNRLFAWKGSFALVPDELDGCYVSNEYPTFKINTEKIFPKYLYYYFSIEEMWDKAFSLSMGVSSISRNRLKVEKFFKIEIPLPPLEEQKRIVAKIEGLMTRIEAAYKEHRAIFQYVESMLNSVFHKLIEGAEYMPMAEVAPIIRRPVSVEIDKEYPEIGIRSFGKGTFHKPAIRGSEVGTKKLYYIEPGDLVFSNVFAWEGAIAVAKPEDRGRVGSHRFITCVPKDGVVTSSFLKFYFLTNEGIEKIRKASPGGAGRNRTLGLKKLENILVPVPDYKKQLWFDSLQAKVDELKKLQEETEKEMEELVPSILDKAFKGEL